MVRTADFAAVLHRVNRRPCHERVAGRTGISVAEAFLRLRSIFCVLLAAGPIFPVDEVETTPHNLRSQSAEIALVDAITAKTCPAILSVIGMVDQSSDVLESNLGLSHCCL